MWVAESQAALWGDHILVPPSSPETIEPMTTSPASTALRPRRHLSLPTAPSAAHPSPGQPYLDPVLPVFSCSMVEQPRVFQLWRVWGLGGGRGVFIW